MDNQAPSLSLIYLLQKIISWDYPRVEPSRLRLTVESMLRHLHFDILHNAASNSRPVSLRCPECLFMVSQQFQGFP